MINYCPTTFTPLDKDGWCPVHEWDCDEYTLERTEMVLPLELLDTDMILPYNINRACAFGNELEGDK